MTALVGKDRAASSVVPGSVEWPHVARLHPRQRPIATASSCQYLEALLASSADSIAAIEPDGTIGFITPRLLSLFNADDPDQLIGRPWLSIWPGDCSGKLRTALDRALAGSPARCEIDCIDGEERHTWWEVRLTPVILPSQTGASPSRASTIVAVARDVTDYHAALSKAEILGRELHHRVRNMMSMVQAIVRIAASTSNDTPTFVDSIEHRMHAMARTHDLLCECAEGEVDVGLLLRSEILPFDRGHAVTLDGPSINVREPRASALGLALHELTANAVKYGCLSTASGQLSVSWEVRDGGDQLLLTWHEQGEVALLVGDQAGFGSLLLDELLLDQLTVTRIWRPTGLLATITVDLRLPPIGGPLN